MQTKGEPAAPQTPPFVRAGFALCLTLHQHFGKPLRTLPPGALPLGALGRAVPVLAAVPRVWAEPVPLPCASLFSRATPAESRQCVAAEILPLPGVGVPVPRCELPDCAHVLRPPTASNVDAKTIALTNFIIISLGAPTT
jgi:hypothetical protein